MQAYLDNSASTQAEQEVVDLMVGVLREDYGNPSALHTMGMRAEDYVKRAREQVAKTLRVLPKEIVFTSGGTEGNNLLLFGAARANQRRGKHILSSPIEHACVYQSLKALEEEGFEVEFLKVDGEGIVDLEDLQEKLREDTILVTVMQVNNEIGSIEPLAQIGSIIKDKNPDCLFHTDAVQSYGKLQIHPRELKLDLLTASGHKIHGPKGSGFVYIREKTKIRPLLFGGGQEAGLRSGTENTAAIAGLGLAAERICQNLDNKSNALYDLKEHMAKRLMQIPGVSINGPKNRKGAPQILSVSVEGVRAEVLLHALEERGVYLSAGAACSSNHPSISRTLQAIDLRSELLRSTVRISFSVHTSREEIDYACDCMQELIPLLARFQRH